MLAILFTFSMVAAACGGDDDDSSSGGGGGDAPKLAIVYSADWFDGSWGQAAYDGANSLLEAGTLSDILLQENVPPGAEAERALRAAAEDGFNPIIAHSFDYGDDVKKVAADFPDTIFVYAGGFGDVAANVGDYDQPFYQASYLSGILAAGVQGGGNVAGAGGYEIPACYSMYQAFLAGAQEVLPSTEGSFVAVGDWYDVQLAKEAALGQESAGATMYIGCGQGPTFGQIEAANDTQGVSTGYVGDMAEVGDSVLSSFVWRLDKVFELMIADVAAGSNEAQFYSVPLSEGGMDVVISAGREDQVSPEALDLYNQRLAEIKDGSFTVPFIPEAG
jgi:basic membrane protein A